MSKYLKILQSFAGTTGGLVVVIVLALWKIDILNFFGNMPTLSLTTFGSWISILVIAFAIIWALMKNKILLSHGVLFYIYSSALSVFITSLFSNSPFSAFSLFNIVSLLAMLYALAVVVAEILYSKPVFAKMDLKSLLPLLLFLIVYYLNVGFSSTLVIGLILLGAVLLGSKIVALLVAASYLIFPIFNGVDTIITLMDNNLPQQVNLIFTLLTYVAALVFIVVDLVRSLSKNEV